MLWTANSTIFVISGFVYIDWFSPGYRLHFPTSLYILVPLLVPRHFHDLPAYSLSAGVPQDAIIDSSFSAIHTPCGLFHPFP